MKINLNNIDYDKVEIHVNNKNKKMPKNGDNFGFVDKKKKNKRNYNKFLEY
jgi:hypothetical protein